MRDSLKKKYNVGENKYEMFGVIWRFGLLLFFCLVKCKLFIEVNLFEIDCGVSYFFGCCYLLLWIVLMLFGLDIEVVVNECFILDIVKVYCIYVYNMLCL